MRKIEHIGIAVKDLQAAKNMYESLLGTACYKVEEVKTEAVLTAFYQIGQSKIELLQATHPQSPIAKFIEKKGEGIHHIAFDVEDINKEIERLQKEGFELIHKEAKEGADNKLIAFLHPKSTAGVLVELCQDQK